MFGGGDGAERWMMGVRGEGKRHRGGVSQRNGKVGIQSRPTTMQLRMHARSSPIAYPRHIHGALPTRSASVAYPSQTRPDSADPRPTHSIPMADPRPPQHIHSTYMPHT